MVLRFANIMWPLQTFKKPELLKTQLLGANCLTPYASQHHVSLANIHQKTLETSSWREMTLRFAASCVPCKTLIKKPVKPVCLALKRLGTVENHSSWKEMVLRFANIMWPLQTFKKPLQACHINPTKALKPLHSAAVWLGVGEHILKTNSFPNRFPSNKV